MRPFLLKHIAIVITLSACASAAMSQYVWLNEKGVKQYSDLPPPPSVPAGKILKTPRGASAPAEKVVKESGEAEADIAKKTAPASIADKNAEFQKRRAEQAENDKKAEDKAKQDAAKQKNCERAREYQRALSSGQRISRLDPAGERNYLSDQDRAKEENDVKRALADCR